MHDLRTGKLLLQTEPEVFFPPGIAADRGAGSRKWLWSLLAVPVVVVSGAIVLFVVLRKRRASALEKHGNRNTDR